MYNFFRRKKAKEKIMNRKEMLSNLQSIARENQEILKEALDSNPLEVRWPEIYCRSKEVRREIFNKYNEYVKEDELFGKILSLKCMEILSGDKICFFNGTAFYMHNVSDWYGFDKCDKEQAIKLTDPYSSYPDALYFSIQSAVEDTLKLLNDILKANY